SPDTAVSSEELATVGQAMTTVPENFTPHPKLKPVLARRQAMAEGREPMDWGFAEMAAFGTILLDGNRVRLSGQDSGRGTFSHRHALLFDYVTGESYAPLKVLSKDPERGFVAYDSLLSEYGVLGFEYGYTVADQGTLVMWEAQFGDF